ncbi:hypothetical protein HZC32_02325 [Candidatus Woesearchaeota archaeon]|nr:hypothetical protein [Candidatus Woesearchaeota archaeon]
MGLLREEIYQKLEEKLNQRKPNSEMVRVLTGLLKENLLLEYLSSKNKSITLYSGGTNEEGIELDKTGLLIRDYERRVSRGMTQPEIQQYAKFLAQRGYTPNKIIATIEQALEKML